MSKKLISTAVAVVSGTALAWGVACSSSNNNPPPDAGSDGSSSGGSSSSSGAGSSSGSSGGSDAGDANTGPTCAASAAGAGQALIDDMSAPTGTGIAFTPTFSPTGCGTKGTWFDYNSGNGTITPAQGSFAFSAQPAGLGGDGGASEAGTPASEAGTSEAGASEAGASDAKAGDGEASVSDASGSSDASNEASADSGSTAVTGPKAACISGMTGSTQYNTSGMGLNLATIPNPLGGNALQVPVNASGYTGIQFWIWGATDGGTQTIIAQLPDKQETAGLGVCDNTNMTPGHECGGATSTFTVTPGWQSKQIPFADFAINMNFGELNETTVPPTLDTKTLTQVQWQIQEPNADAGSGVPFNFCVFDVSFY